MNRNKFLAYSDLRENFKIHTGANKFQLGSVIIQKGKRINLYSRKLKKERDFLSIAKNLKSFRTILRFQKIILYSNHKTTYI